MKVNKELLELYWHIGEDIVHQQRYSKWGDGLLHQMSVDLKKTFPDMSGFSETNLKTMRLWYRFYADVVNGQQVVDCFVSFFIGAFKSLFESISISSPYLVYFVLQYFI